MFKTLQQDRDTILRKYHDPGKEFNPFNRMAYHGYEYDAATGLDDEQMDQGLLELGKELGDLPHPVYKARMFEYVLDHTRIDVNEKDYFIGIYSWGRPLSKHTISKWEEVVYADFSEEVKLLKDYDNAGAIYGWLDFDHTVPDWDALMELGFSGLLKRACTCYEKLKSSGKLTEKQEHFFRGMEIEYQAIIRFIDRLCSYAKTRSFDKAPTIARCLEHLRDGAPTDTYEALQLIYIYFMISESIEHYQVRSLGYGLDATLYPFYKKDLESGKYTEEEIAEYIGYFLMQWSAIDNYWGQPFYLAGTHVDGSTKVNELSYLILDVYDKLGIYNPKIQIKIHRNTPKDFVFKALEMIRHGISSIVFVSEDIITKSLMARGFSYDDSLENAVLSGCYEYAVKGRDIGVAGGYLNALKPVSLVLDNGLDVVTQNQIGIQTGPLENLISFHKFYRAYLDQLEHLIRSYLLEAMNNLATRVHEVNPSLLFSGTVTDCVETMTDALDCGIENVMSITLSAIATAVDALMAVKELVYDKKIVTLTELNQALHADWVGYESLRQMALHSCSKYGNGNPAADYYAAAITRFVSELLREKKNSHNGRFLLEMHSARAFVIQGEKTIATPDGRKARDETSKNASPTPGADRNGITALIHSATQIDSVLCDCGFCLDAMLHPSAVQGEDGLMALYATLMTYVNKGGASIHFNIFNADTLRDAQMHPEKYQNLQVRVCGWNILWNNMDKKEQDAYILRAENIQQ